MHLITEIVTFKLPAGTTREDVFSKYEKTAPVWKANPDLIRKYYIFDAEQGIAGGVYLWKEKAHAEKWHGEEFRRRVKEMYGAEPDCRYFETPIVVENSPI
jgi:Putative mono-oxygenase ydhR